MKMILLLATLFAFPAFAGEITVNVKGMVCSMCAQGIEKKFKAAGMESVHVNLDEKVVHLSGPDMSDEAITKLITEAGYNVAKISRK
jgi:mercuric ion binding protein